MSKGVSRIAFGSCTSQHHEEQPFWPVIMSRNVTAFIWGGDAVYADDRLVKRFPKKKLMDATPDYLNKLLTEQRNVPGYKALLESNVSIFGTVDDHDYGRNNGDKTFPWRRENAIEFVKFLGLSEESAMFKRAHEGRGIYGVQVYDFSRSKPNERLLTDTEAALDPDVVPIVDAVTEDIPSDNRLVAVFVIDVRSNKIPWPGKISERFSGNNSGDFLGEEQFVWFETAIGRSRAAVNIVVSGLQVHAERFYDGAVVENWNGFPHAQHRLHQALLQSNVQAPILITGDVHHAQILRKDCRRQHSDLPIRPLYEITTSGMTHAWGSTRSSVCGRARLSPFCNVYYYNKMWGWVMHFAHWISPWNEIVIDEKTRKLQYSLDLNIAELDFDWVERKVLATILGSNGEPLLQQKWPFDDLSIVQKTTLRDQDFDLVSQYLRDRLIGGENNDWTCVHYRGIPSPLAFALSIVVTVTVGFTLLGGPTILILLIFRRLWLARSRNSRKRKET
eukprot:scaffold1525_cov142-Cylindrotheca_fusiformis.AAC.173